MPNVSRHPSYINLKESGFPARLQRRPWRFRQATDIACRSKASSPGLQNENDQIPISLHDFRLPFGETGKNGQFARSDRPHLNFVVPESRLLRPLMEFPRLSVRERKGLRTLSLSWRTISASRALSISTWRIRHLFSILSVERSEPR